MAKSLISIPAWGGINALHARNPGQPSNGKNFIVENGELSTRGGSSLVASTDFDAAIRSIHAAAKAGANTRFLAEEGANLWHRTSPTGEWVKLKEDVNGAHPINSTIWSTGSGDNYAMLVNGAQMRLYDITAGTVSDMQNLATGETTVPAMEFVSNIRGTNYVFAWAPNYTDPHLLRYNGVDGDGYPSIDYWPSTNAINISGDASEPVVDCLQLNAYSIALTIRGYYRVMGIPGGFEPYPGGGIGAYGVRCAAVVANVALWLGADRKVYAYTGTEAYPISQPVDKYLKAETYTNVFSARTPTQFWLCFPGTTTTTCYVFDVREKAWFIFVYPFVFKAACLFGEYLATEYLHFGLSDGRILRTDTSTSDAGTAITTDLTLGPMGVGGQFFSAPTMHLTANPAAQFALSVYRKENNHTEAGPETATFAAGVESTQEINLHGITGRNLIVRMTTTNKVDSLLSGEITVDPKVVK